MVIDYANFLRKLWLASSLILLSFVDGSLFVVACCLVFQDEGLDSSG